MEHVIRLSNHGHDNELMQADYDKYGGGYNYYVLFRANNGSDAFMMEGHFMSLLGTRNPEKGYNAKDHTKEFTLENFKKEDALKLLISTQKEEIKIDGKTIDYNALNPLLGNLRMDLPDGARKVEIVNPENHPAWGAVVHQYEASMQDIQKQSVKELSIRKELWAQDDKGEWQRLSLEGKDRPALHEFV